MSAPSTAAAAAATASSASQPDPLIIDGTSTGSEDSGPKAIDLPDEARSWEKTIGRYTFHYFKTKASGWGTEESEGVLAIQVICWHRFVSNGKRTGHRFVIGRHSLWITKAR